MSSTDMGGEYGGSRPPGASGSTPKDMAKEAAQAVKEEAASFAADARTKAAETIDQKKETASRTLGDFANAVRKAGDELAQSDQSMATQFVRQAADGLESFARSVADKRPEEMLDTVRDFGRRNPMAFVAGSVLAGFAIGRLLRSSGSHAATSGEQWRRSDLTAPGGAPPTYPLTDLETTGATVLGAGEGADEVEDPQSGAAGGPPSGLAEDAGRYGSRS